MSNPAANFEPYFRPCFVSPAACLGRMADAEDAVQESTCAGMGPTATTCRTTRAFRFDDPARNQGHRGARDHPNGGKDRQCGLSRDRRLSALVTDYYREGARYTGSKADDQATEGDHHDHHTDVSEQVTQKPTPATVDLKLEAVVIPVSDVDRAKRFYESLGWRLDADFPACGTGAGCRSHLPGHRARSSSAMASRRRRRAQSRIFISSCPTLRRLARSSSAAASK